MKRIGIAGLLVMLFLGVGMLAASADPVMPDAWQKEFALVCSQTSYSMEMDAAALEDMLQSCRRLEAELDKMDAAEVRVLRKRLSLACNLYGYMLEVRKQEQARKGEGTSGPAVER